MHLYKNLTAPDGTPFNLTIKTQNPTDVVTVEGSFSEKDLQVGISELYGKKLVAKAPGFPPVILTDYWNIQPEDDLLLCFGGADFSLPGRNDGQVKHPFPEGVEDYHSKPSDTR